MIDADAHEGMGEIAALVPYLNSHWQRYLVDYRWRGKGGEIPFCPPTDRQPWGTTGECLDVEVMARELLDGDGVDVAIVGNPRNEFARSMGWPELNIALATAYNKWVIEHWLDKEPRLRGSITIAPHDPARAAAEIDRVADHPQMVQVVLPLMVERQFGEPYYHPIFEAAERHGLPVALRPGSWTKSAHGYGRYYVQWHTTANVQAMMCQIISLVCHGVFDLHPRLTVVGLGTGFAWLPALMARMDRQYFEFRHEIPWVKSKPSEYLRRQLRLATHPLDDHTAEHFEDLVDMIGSDEVLVYASGYPDYDGDKVASVEARIPEGLRDQVMSGNAERTYPRLAAGVLRRA